MHGGFMICLEMFGNGVQIFMMKIFMVRIEFLEVVARRMKNGVLWPQLEEEVIQFYSKSMTWDLGSPRIGNSFRTRQPLSQLMQGLEEERPPIDWLNLIPP